MELLTGESLADLLSRNGRLSQRRTVELVRQIGQRLAALHARGVVHGDLRPRHVVLAPEPDGAQVVKLLGSSGPEPTASRVPAARAGQPAWSSGDPRYLAPEQREGKRADARSDVFALMLMAHEMLAGSLPPLSERPRSARPSSPARDADLSRLERALPGLHAGLEAAFRRALAAAPERRVSSMEELLKLLPEPSAIPPESPAGGPRRVTTLPLGARALAARTAPAAQTVTAPELPALQRTGRRPVNAQRIILEAATSSEIGLSAEWYASGEVLPSLPSSDPAAVTPALHRGDHGDHGDDADDERHAPSRWPLIAGVLAAASVTVGAVYLGLSSGMIRIVLP
jgi:serine/threonine-protein kinase